MSDTLILLQNGVLDKYNVELLGAKLPSINRAEDRSLFRDAMAKIGLRTPQSGIANTWEEALEVPSSQPRQLLIFNTEHICCTLAFIQLPVQVKL